MKAGESKGMNHKDVTSERSEKVSRTRTEKVARDKENKEIRSVEAVAKRLGTFKSSNEVRQFSFLIDEPHKLGGTDEAPTPMEYMLASFNGCLLIVVEMVAKELNVPFRRLRAHASGTMDRRGLFGTAEVSPHFLDVTHTLHIETEESAARLEEIKAQVRQRCPAYNLFHDAGINIVLDWHIVKGDH